MGLRVPEAAGVGRDFVGQNDGSVGRLAELQLEIDQLHSALQEELLKVIVHAEGVVGNRVHVLAGGPAAGQDVVFVDHRVAQRVVLVAELDRRAVEVRALGHAEALGEGAGRDVADDDLERHDLHLPDQRVALGELLDKVRGNPRLVGQLLHQEVGHAVVDHALAGDRALLQAVEGGRVVLVGDDAVIGVVGRKHFLGLALIHLLALFHGSVLLF